MKNRKKKTKEWEVSKYPLSFHPLSLLIESKAIRYTFPGGGVLDGSGSHSMRQVESCRAWGAAAVSNPDHAMVLVSMSPNSALAFQWGQQTRGRGSSLAFRSLILGWSCRRCEPLPSPPVGGVVTRLLCLEAWTMLKAQALADRGSQMVASCPTTDSSSCPPLTG